MNCLRTVFVLIISFSLSKENYCDFHCQDGPTADSTDCYAVVGCDFSFPDTPNPLEYMFQVHLNFTETTIKNAVPRNPFVYSGIIRWHEYITVNRYVFQLGRTDVINLCDLTFSILNLRPEDAGTYEVSLIKYTDFKIGQPTLHHVYRLFTRNGQVGK